MLSGYLESLNFNLINQFGSLSESEFLVAADQKNLCIWKESENDTRMTYIEHGHWTSVLPFIAVCKNIFLTVGNDRCLKIWVRKLLNS